MPHARRRGPVRSPGPGSEQWLPSERRLVSVLFVDLEDFTALAESLDPEDVRNLQARYFEAARSVVAHYGGMLEKFIGDAVMAVWGAQAAHEDDGERAVRAGLELVAAVVRLRGASADQPLSARAAVGTGEVAVTPGVDGQGLVAGDLVNTAARLQAAAPSGGVLVDDTTRRVVGDGIVFTPAGPMTLRGKSRPVTAWLAVEVAAERPKGRAAGHAGPFIGRSAEFAELVDLFERTVAARRSRIVSVLGIAGIGKSRLVWEFERYLDALPEILALHIGRTPSYGDGITFAPIAEMVRRRATDQRGHRDRARDPAAAKDARRARARRGRAALDRAAPRDPPRTRARTPRSTGTSCSRPGDASSSASPSGRPRSSSSRTSSGPTRRCSTSSTTSRRGRARIRSSSSPWPGPSCSTDARPGVRASTASPPSSSSRCPTKQMVELLLGLEPDLPAGVVRRIVDRAGGVPLYGVEVLRMLVDRGRADGRGARSEPLDTLDQMQIPDTLRSLVSARIDALPPADRSCLLSASVLGGRFHPDALAAIGHLEPAERPGPDRRAHPPRARDGGR